MAAGAVLVGIPVVAVGGVADLAVDIVSPVVTSINWVLFVFAVVIELVAFVHCVMQRRDAFEAIGTLPKGIWLALIGGSLLLTLVLVSVSSIFGLIGITAAAVYLLDVRRGIRDLSDGNGPW